MWIADSKKKPRGQILDSASSQPPTILLLGYATLLLLSLFAQQSIPSFSLSKVFFSLSLCNGPPFPMPSFLVFSFLFPMCLRYMLSSMRKTEPKS